MGWNLGHKMADAIAKLFSGEANFSGKLSATIPACEGQIPVYYAKKKLGRPYVKSNATWRFQARYDDGLTDPAYVFGYGLSYSKFIYGEITLDKETMEKGGQIVASINITNDSDCDGVEVVQLYINDKVSEVVRPEKELKGFKRIFMKAHETKKVDFVITEEKLQYYHFDGKCFADSGEFEVFIGSDSNVENKKLFILR
jgi:beta-glucosidase